MPFVPEISSTAKHAERTWLVIHPKGLVARREGDRLVFPTDEEVLLLARAEGALPIRTRGSAAPDETVERERHRLGSLDSRDVFALPLGGAIAPPFETFALRALAALLAPALFAVVGRAMHACDWLTTSRFCGRCGTATNRSATERCAVCPACQLHVYPRISPAIITLVRKGDLALLANNAKFPGAFYSTLAGFADIGESLEETLVREVREEVGVTVRNVRYFGSQPWPFPNSLMVAFTAEYDSGEILIDPTEIADAQWFAADALPMLPPPLSIARRLIDDWLANVRG